MLNHFSRSLLITANGPDVIPRMCTAILSVGHMQPSEISKLLSEVLRLEFVDSFSVLFGAGVGFVDMLSF